MTVEEAEKYTAWFKRIIHDPSLPFQPTYVTELVKAYEILLEEARK